MQGSERVFNGAYFEVMEHTGVMDVKGEQVKILGTYVGENSGTFTDEVVTTQEVHTTKLDIHPSPENIEVITYNGENVVEASPVVPLYARRELETTMNGNKVTNPEYRYGYYGGKLEDDRIWLRNHPEAHQPRILKKRSDGTEVWVENDGTEVVRDNDRERAALQSFF
jgi:hypothetical protein